MTDKRPNRRHGSDEPKAYEIGNGRPDQRLDEGLAAVKGSGSQRPDGTSRIRKVVFLIFALVSTLGATLGVVWYQKACISNSCRLPFLTPPLTLAAVIDKDMRPLFDAAGNQGRCAYPVGANDCTAENAAERQIALTFVTDIKGSKIPPESQASTDRLVIGLNDIVAGSYDRGIHQVLAS